MVKKFIAGILLALSVGLVFEPCQECMASVQRVSCFANQTKCNDFTFTKNGDNCMATLDVTIYKNLFNKYGEWIAEVFPIGDSYGCLDSVYAAFGAEGEYNNIMPETNFNPATTGYSNRHHRKNKNKYEYISISFFY